MEAEGEYEKRFPLKFCCLTFTVLSQAATLEITEKEEKK